MVGTREAQPIGQVKPKFFMPITVRFSEPMYFDRFYDRQDDPLVLRQITDEIMFTLRELTGQVYVNRYAKRGEAVEGVSAESSVVVAARRVDGRRAVPATCRGQDDGREHVTDAVPPRKPPVHTVRLALRHVTTYVVRVWVPDRPGALGAVASRIGAVRGDLVGIDILERGGGRAIDELLVDLPDDDLVPLLISEVAEVDGVDVEDVRPAADWLSDPRLDALETAAVLVEQHERDRPARSPGVARRPRLHGRVGGGGRPRRRRCPSPPSDPSRRRRGWRHSSPGAGRRSPGSGRRGARRRGLGRAGHRQPGAGGRAPGPAVPGPGAAAAGALARIANHRWVGAGDQGQSHDPPERNAPSHREVGSGVPAPARASRRAAGPPPAPSAGTARRRGSHASYWSSAPPAAAWPRRRARPEGGRPRRVIAQTPSARPAR